MIGSGFFSTEVMESVEKAQKQEDRKPHKSRVLATVLHVLPAALQVGAVETSHFQAHLETVD